MTVWLQCICRGHLVLYLLWLQMHSHPLQIETVITPLGLQAYGVGNDERYRLHS